jgi:hypothetical protein
MLKGQINPVTNSRDHVTMLCSYVLSIADFFHFPVLVQLSVAQTAANLFISVFIPDYVHV